MQAHAFSPPPPLADVLRLRRIAEYRQPLRELAGLRYPVIDDLADARRSATYLATHGDVNNAGLLSTITNLEYLWLAKPTRGMLDDLSELPKLRGVCLGSLRGFDPRPVAACRALEDLVLDSVFGPLDLGFLRDLPALRTFYAVSVKRADFASLPELPALEAFGVVGGLRSDVKVPSLIPLTRLMNLRCLDLVCVKPMDKSLEPLHALNRLGELHLSNYFSVEECAKLSGALPQAFGSVLQPIYAQNLVSHPCGTCSKPRIMLTGRPAVILCPDCDEHSVSRRAAKFEMIRAGAA